MDICCKHHDYITNVRKKHMCNLECCSASDKKEGNTYCEHFKNGLPEIVVAIVPDDITIENKRIMQDKSKYKTLKEYTDNYNITDEQIELILKKKLRRDTRFYKKIELVEQMLNDRSYDPVSDYSANRTVDIVYSHS